MKFADSPRKGKAEKETLREIRLDQMTSTLTKAYRDWEQEEQEQKGEKQTR